MHTWFHAQLAQKILNGIQYVQCTVVYSKRGIEMSDMEQRYFQRKKIDKVIKCKKKQFKQKQIVQTILKLHIKLQNVQFEVTNQLG